MKYKIDGLISWKETIFQTRSGSLLSFSKKGIIKNQGLYEERVFIHQRERNFIRKKSYVYPVFERQAKAPIEKFKDILE